MYCRFARGRGWWGCKKFVEKLAGNIKKSLKKCLTGRKCSCIIDIINVVIHNTFNIKIKLISALAEGE